MAKDGIAPAPLGGADFDDGLDEVIAMGEAASTQSSGSKPRVTSPPPKVTYGSSPATPSVSPVSSASLGGSSSSSRASSTPPPKVTYSSPSASPSVSPVSSASLGGSNSSSHAARHSVASSDPASPALSSSQDSRARASSVVNTAPSAPRSSVSSAAPPSPVSASVPGVIGYDNASSPTPSVRQPKSSASVALSPQSVPLKEEVVPKAAVVQNPVQNAVPAAEKPSANKATRSSPYYVGQDGIEKKTYDTNLAKVAVDRRASNISHTVQNAFKVMKDKLPYRAVAFQANYEVDPDSGKKYFNSFKDKIGYMLNKVTNPREEGPVVSTHIVKGNREQNIGATDKKIIIAKGAEGWSDYEQMKSGDKFAHKTAHGVTASQLPDSPRLRAAALATSSSLQKTGTSSAVTAEAIGVGPRTGAVTSAELVRAQNTAEMQGLSRSDGTAAVAAQFRDTSSPEKDQIQQEAIARATLDGRGSSSLGR